MSSDLHGSQLQRAERSHLDTLGRILFSALRDGGFCTHLVNGRSSWNPRSAYFESARRAASQGRRITRAFLLPHRHCRHDANLQEHVSLDRSSGIEAIVVHVGDLVADRALPNLDSLNFGIWDNEIGCVAIPSSRGDMDDMAELRITRRAEDLQSLRQAMTCIIERGELLSSDTATSDTLDLEEPMITTAPLAHQLSRVLCRGDHVSPGDCSWYHSVWQYLRIFDVVSTPTWHTEFYRDTFRELSLDASVHRIGITGTADYSMLAHVLWAMRNRERPPSVVVADLCETPLFLCKWYAKSVGVAIETCATDVIKFTHHEPMDLITTDAFLTRFSEDAKRQVLVDRF